MTTTTKMVLAALIAAVAAVGIYGGYKYLLAPKASLLAGTSVSGSTQSSQFVIGVSGWTPSNGATSTSVTNNTGQDVLVTGCFAQTENATTSYTAVTGAGLANFNIKAATTSTVAPAVVSNTNYVLNMNIATGTTAAGTAGFGQVLQSTSSVTVAAAGTAGAFIYNVPAGSNLTFFTNATTSSTYSVQCPYITN